MAKNHKWLIAVFIGWAASEAQSSHAHAPHDRGPAQEQHSTPATQTTKSPSPVIIYLTPEQADDARRNQAESQQHDAIELDAQVRAADAAEGQINPAWLGAFLNILGTILLVWTLFETRKAAKAGRDAADSARESLNADRAWLCPLYPTSAVVMDSIIDGNFVQSGFMFLPQWKNYGRSPAIQISAKRLFVTAPLDAMPPVFDDTHLNDVGICGPGDDVASRAIALNGEQTLQFRSRQIKVFVYSFLSYRDIYSDAQRLTEACYEITHSGGTKTTNGVTVDDLSMTPVGPQNRVT